MIFTPSVLHHQSCGKHCNLYFPDTFSLLCWNVHKSNKTNPAFKPFIQKLLTEKHLYLCMFQEAEFLGETFIIDECAYDAAANLEIKKYFYGVLTACRTESSSAKAFLSKKKEGMVGPYKSLLLSTYPLSEEKTLLVLNIHAINFRENSTYALELEAYTNKVKAHKGPMIVAGDFNAWNKTRREELQKLCKALSLEMVVFENTGKVKSFMGYPLDFVLYRGLKCIEKEVIDDHGISDHNPLWVTFQV